MNKRAILLSAVFACSMLGTALATPNTTTANKIKSIKKASTKWILGKQKIQVALLMDTSGSMDGLIEQAKSQLWSIVNELATAEYNGTKPTIEIALYHYGNDGLDAKNNYIQQILPFTTDLDKVSEELFKLKTNGGNEYCGAVIEDATLNLAWTESNEDLKLVYIAGNEPFNQGGVDYKKACREAIKKGIIINTIYCGGESEGVNSFWKDGALLADGEFITINMNEQTVYIETPFDSTLLRLNNELNATYIFYGSEGEIAAENQVKQDDNAKGYSGANFAERTVTKANTAYYNASWDLVDKSKEKDFDLKKIAIKELPAIMQDMDENEKLTYITTQATKRDTIKNEINALNVQRQNYIDEKKKEMGATNSLDKAVIGSVTRVAEKKNYTFTKNN
jgi:hypothetical protein